MHSIRRPALYTGTIAWTCPAHPAPWRPTPHNACSTPGCAPPNQIAAYRIDPGSGTLSLLGKVALDADPCYLATDRRGRYLFSAYYHAGKVAVHALDADGAVGAEVAAIATAAHAHCIQADPGNRFVFVSHPMPSNRIVQFEFDQATGALTLNRSPYRLAPYIGADPDAGVGPRHFVFHPEQTLVYVSNEQGSSVTAYRYAAGRGDLSPFQTVSTLPAAYSGANTCAQIHIHPTGRFLYVSNRGHDSIACFALESDGSLRSLGQAPTEATPRRV